MQLEAVVFDFDGLILDTEWPIYEMARASFDEFGVTVEVADWATVVGLADEDHDWFELLAERVGFTVDKAEFQAAYRAQDRSYRHTIAPNPGVVELLDALAAAGLPVGIASSSPEAWLEDHLARVGLRGRFTAVLAVDHVGGVGKPAPDLYLAACRALSVEPARSVALEDSAHGVTAAKAAGMLAVAVPTRITRHSAFDHADLVVDSLVGVAVEDLAALVR